MKNLITNLITIISVIFILAFGVCYVIAFSGDHRWNDGKCSRCEDGQMNFLEISNHDYYYRCDTCGNIDRYAMQVD